MRIKVREREKEMGNCFGFEPEAPAVPNEDAVRFLLFYTHFMDSRVNFPHVVGSQATKTG